MKKYLLILIVSIFSLTVMSCEKDEFNSSNNGQGDSDCCGHEIPLPIEPGDTLGEG